MKKTKTFAKKLLRGFKITLLRTIIFSIIAILVLMVWKRETDFGNLWNAGVLVGILMAFLYPLKRSASSIDHLEKHEYKKDLAIYNLHDTVKFSELLKRSLGKVKSERCGLYLLSDRLVFQKACGNVEIDFSNIKDVYPVRESLLAKILIDSEFAVKTDSETYVFKSSERNEWIDKINTAVKKA